MKKRIISLTIILIILFTNYVFAVVVDNGEKLFVRFDSNNSPAGAKLNTIAKEAKIDLTEAKYSAKTVTPEEIIVYKYKTTNEFPSLQNNLETTIDGDKQYLDFVIPISLQDGIATILYKNAVEYLGKEYNIKLDIEKMTVSTNLANDNLQNKFRIRLGSIDKTQISDNDKNLEKYNKVKPQIGLLNGGENIRLTINYYIVDDNNNPVPVCGTFAITDIDSAQGIWVEKYKIQDKRAYMTDKLNNDLYYQYREVANLESAYGTYIFSGINGDQKSESCSTYLLMDDLPSGNHIHMVLTWNDDRDSSSNPSWAASELYFADIRTQYNITYEMNGETNNTGNPATYNKGTEVTFKNPSRNGYVFKGWYTDSACTNEIKKIGTEATGDKKVYAKWELCNYSLKYILNGGIRHANNVDRTFTINDQINFDDPTRQGYTFCGWYTTSNFSDGTKIDGVGANTTHDVTAYAHWIPNNDTGYKVEHRTSTGENTYKVLSTETKTGTTGKITPEAEFINISGYTKDENNPNNHKSEAIKAEGTTTLVLYYTKDTYRINYHLDGGTNNPKNPSSYTVDDDTITFDKPEKLGYDFIEWYADSEHTQEKPSIGPNSTGNIDVYAKWQAKGDIPYTVKHWYENSEGKYIQDTNYYEEHLSGYTDDPVEAKTRIIAGYKENTSHTNAKGKITADGKLVLNLYYDRIEYKIEYETYGGTNNSENPTSYKTGDVIEKFYDPIKEGYYFRGWYEDEDFTLSKTKIKNEIGDKKLFAKWDIRTDIPYKVEHYKETTKGNYELAVTEKLEGEYNKEVTAVAKNFEGYTENKEHSSRVASDIVKLDGSLVLKLYYDKNNYSVKFNTDGGKPTPETQTVPYGDKATKPTDPTKSGYTFIGWVDENGKTYSFDTLVTGNIKLTAKWKSNTTTGNSDTNGKSASETNQNGKPSTLPKTGFQITLTILAIITLAAGTLSGIRYFKINKMMK